MAHQHAICVVAAPLETVEAIVRDVERWPAFLTGLERVTRTSYGRYTFTLRHEATRREVEVAALHHPAEHRFAWHALHGSRFEGEFRLAPVDHRRTSVSLSLTEDPAGFREGLGELAGLTHASAAVLDLQRLEAVATAQAASAPPPHGP